MVTVVIEAGAGWMQLSQHSSWKMGRESVKEIGKEFTAISFYNYSMYLLIMTVNCLVSIDCGAFKILPQIYSGGISSI